MTTPQTGERLAAIDVLGSPGWELDLDGLVLNQVFTHLAYAAVMVFPEPTGVLAREQILESLGNEARWSEVAFEDHRVLQLSDRAALISYRAVARRGDREPYTAYASSAYVRDGGSWKLAFHQQTPLANVDLPAEDVSA